MWTVTGQTKQLLLQFENIIDSLTDISDMVKNFLKVWIAPLNDGTTQDQKMIVYLVYMTERLVLMKKVLKDTGSIYFHCDQTASHYIKIIMDGIFERKNFKNEIIWHYFKPNSTKKNYPKNYDNILFYTKKDIYYFSYESCIVKYDNKSIRRYDKVDENGKRYKLYNNKDGIIRKAYLNEGER